MLKNIFPIDHHVKSSQNFLLSNKAELHALPPWSLCSTATKALEYTKTVLQCVFMSPAGSVESDPVDFMAPSLYSFLENNNKEEALHNAL